VSIFSNASRASSSASARASASTYQNGRVDGVAAFVVDEHLQGW
jgi:hypothetical protein